MGREGLWAIGVDLGGTKTRVARVTPQGRILGQRRFHTRSVEGAAAVEEDIVEAVSGLLAEADSGPAGVGVGVAGQIDALTGVVRFAPNLDWRDLPLRSNLEEALGLPVTITNDVRAATWGEWLHGAGHGCDDLICLFVGTGIGGGVVSGGGMLTGCSNTAGELGHITIDLNGPPCHCGNRGCLEALAGGWAIARRAREAVAREGRAGALLLELAGGDPERVTAGTVSLAVREGDPLALRLVAEVAEALTAGVVSLVNAFNPCRLILGGGVVAGLPQLVERVEHGVRQRVLAAAGAPLHILSSQLGDDAGVVGAAVVALRRSTGEYSNRC